MKNLTFNFKSIVQTKARWLLTFCALLTLGIGQVWAWGSYTFSGDYLYFKANNIRNESGTSMEWMKDGAYARCYGALSSNESGGTTYNYYRNEVDETNHIYRTVLPSGTWNLVQLVRCSSTGSNWTWSYKMDASNFANGKNYLWDDGTNYNWSYFAEDAYVVFDNSDANWDTESVSKYIYFNIGRSGYTSGGNDYKMTNVTNTKLYYKRIQKWANYDRYRFCYTSNYDQHNTDMQVTPSVDGYTAIVQNSTDVVLKVNTLNLYTFSGSNGTAVTKTECDEYADLNNITIYIKEKYNSSGAGTFVEVSSGTAHGTISASGYVFDSWTTCTGTATGASITKETETYSSSSVFGYTSTVTLTAGATKAGKAFVGWYRSDGTLISTDLETTITAKTNNEVVYAYYKDEVTNDITVSYKCGDDVIKTATTELAVGVTTTRSVTAPNIDHYEFVNWTYGNGVTVDDDDETTININSVGNGSNTYTLTANYKHLTRFYFANTSSWSNVYAYMWQESSKDGSGTPSKKNANWPGEAISSQEVDPCGLTLYYYDYDASTGDAADWDHIIFNNGSSGSGNQTSDLTTSGNTDKMYVLSKTAWYDINNHTVSVVSAANHMGTVSGGGTAKAYGCSAAISAEEKPGYRFDRWEVTSGTAEIANASSITTTVTASEDATITAYFNQTKIIYFDNTMSKWDDSNGIWVYLFDNNYGVWYDDEINGGVHPGVNRVEYGRMTRIGSSNIYYYKYSTDNTITGVAFAKADQHGNASFYQTSAAWITNFNTCLPCYMASERYISKNSTGYHSYGYWKRWGNTNSGFTLYYKDAGKDENSIEFTTEDPTSSVYTATVNLTSDNSNYTYNVARCNSAAKLRRAEYNGEIQDSDSDYPRELSDGANADGILRTSAAGTYNFTLSLASDHIMMTVEYPLSVGDYRVRLFNAVQNHPSGRIIRARTEERTDTVSFFIDHTKTNYLYIDTCTNTGNPPSWNRITDVAAATIELNSAPYNTTTGIYKFGITRTKKKDVRLELLAEPQYDGNYYIRTDAANGKWDNYYTDPDNVMTYSDYSNTHCGYSHYFTNWVNKDDSKRKNVKFVIANDYSPCISDTLARETASGTWANIATFMEEGGDLKRSANVRFMWNIATNDVSRAYIDGAQEDGSEFLQLLSADSKIKQGETTKTEVTFNDNGNWIYEANVMAQPGAAIKLKSTWGEGGTVIEQYFKGSSESTETLIGGSTSKWYPIRLIYDFKTNRLVASYVPATGDISEQLAINADVMFIREHQGDIAQLTFSKADEESPMGAISNINTAYGVMRFNKWTLNNKNTTEPHAALTPLLTKYQRDLYWISFPFRVNLEEVFGFGTYGTHWIIEEYDGAGRAKNGFWADSPSFWRFITNRSGKILEPNTGYILALDLDELGESSSVWTNTDEVELYFPSYGSLSSITSSAVTYNIPEHTCGIGPRFPGGDDRRVKDSHWNVMSVPTYINTNEVSFANTTWITAGDGQLGPNFLYEWDSSDNSLEVRSGTGYTYHAMHAYMVQYCGNVTWTASVTPASIAARLLETQDREYKLVLQSVERTEDQTFVRLTDDENVTSEFEFNYDLSKEMNKNRGNIYTLISTTIDSVPSITEAAANMQPKPVQTTLVPVGVKVVANGEYTLSMPEGTNGEDVFLIDNAYGTRTNLGLMPYTVTLTAGTYDSRFALEFGPIQDAPTGIEQMSTVNSQLSTDSVRKVFVGGRLYIIRDGKVYDAAGQRVE